MSLVIITNKFNVTFVTIRNMNTICLFANIMELRRNRWMNDVDVIKNATQNKIFWLVSIKTGR